MTYHGSYGQHIRSQTQYEPEKTGAGNDYVAHYKLFLILKLFIHFILFFKILGYILTAKVTQLKIDYF